MSEAAFKPNVGQVSASATHRGCVADSALVYTATPACETLFETGELRRAIERHIGGGTPSRSISSYWNGDIPWASVKDFEDGQSEISATQETITNAGLGASASNLIPAGIPVVCTRMAVGRAALTAVPMAINQDVKALFPAVGVHPRHLLRLLHYAQRKADATAVGSTVKGIRVQDYLSIVVPQAPTKEQPLIARVLDTLDTAIRQTEVILAKLKQVKQGLLHDLLTRGIDVNGELRPPQSQAPNLYKQSQLGWMPREWEPAVVGDLIADSYRYPSYFGIGYVDVGVLEVRGELICADGSVDPSPSKYRRISEPTAAQFSRVRLVTDDVVMTVRGTIGKFARVPSWLAGGVITANLLKLTPNHLEVETGWLMELLLSQSFQERLDAACSSTTIKTIQVPELLSIKVSRPPKKEQVEIAQRLQAHQRRVDCELDMLGKLKQQKSALMDDLLSGRVRVTPLLEDEAAAA